MNAVAEEEPSPGRFDVFIGYSWLRTEDRAHWLRDRLRTLGYRVFLDKDEIDLRNVPGEQLKEHLIRTLTWAVRSSRARIVFAAVQRPYLPTPGYDQAAAVTCGLATLLQSGLVIEWNWQSLELAQSRRHLVIERSGVAYVADGEGCDQQFGTRINENDAGLEAVVVQFLEKESVRPSALRELQRR